MNVSSTNTVGTTLVARTRCRADISLTVATTAEQTIATSQSPATTERLGVERVAEQLGRDVVPGEGQAGARGDHQGRRQAATRRARTGSAPARRATMRMTTGSEPARSISLRDGAATAVSPTPAVIATTAR